MSSVWLVCVLAVACCALAEVQVQSQTSIEFELGSVYSLDIPTQFSNYQKSALKSFKKIQQTYTLPRDICQIRTKQQGKLTEKSKWNYSAEGFKYNRDRVIYKLKDLQQSKIVIDSIVWGDKIVALFGPNEIIMYSISNKTGAITQQSKYKLDESSQELVQALFVLIKDNLFLISSRSILKIDANGIWSLVAGYKPATSPITAVLSLQNKLYIGLGQKGLAVYSLDSSFQTLTLETTSQFFYTQNNQSISFDVDQFQIYPTEHQTGTTGKKVYVLDYTEGLIQIALESIKANHTFSTQPRFLASSCRNLVIFSNSIYMTCPELLQVTIDTYFVNTNIEVGFFTQYMQLQKDRLFLYGTQNFAVFDIFGRTLVEYKQPGQSQLSVVFQGYLVSFGRESVVSHQIVPQQQQLYCFSNDPQKVGQYTGFVQIAGVCKQVHGQVSVTKKSWQIYCLIDLPIRVILKNSASLSVKIQIAVAVLWAIGLLIGLVALKLKNVLLARKYEQLLDQQEPNIKENVPQLNQHNKLEDNSQINSATIPKAFTVSSQNKFT